MSIRLLAIELYRVMKQVEELEKKLKSLPVTAPIKERNSLEEQLRVLRAERDRIKSMLEGAKEN